MSEKKQSYRERMEIDEIIKFEIDRAESEGCFLSAGQGDGGRKNLKL